MPYVPPNNMGSSSPGEENESPRRTYRRRRQLNVTGIKSFIVFFVGAITALIGGLTGMSAQVIFAPMLTWMLGFAPEKAQGTAMSYAAWAASAAVAGAYVAGGTPAGYVLAGVSLALGAVLGAILTAPIAKKLQGNVWRRTFQTLGIAITMAVVVQVSHSSGLFMGRPNLQEWHSPPWMLLIGLVVGTATTIMGLTSGTLLVPALYFLSGLRAAHSNYAAPAVALSVLVVALTSALPAATYGKRGLVDIMYRTPVVLAAIAGGFCGGLLLTHVMERVVIVFSAVVAMFLCARELSRLAYADKE
jgi:uncharacterized membrane protein YfcA